jgi:release factor glutamine methyltransferase
MPREKDISPDDLGPPWTIRKLLRWTASYFDQKNVTDTPRLDADLILGEVLDMERVELYARSKETVEEAPRSTFRELVQRRADGEPVAYLIGYKSFWQMEFQTDDRALIPRPETEVLVETALDVMSEEPGRIVDVGTGVGAVAAALASERPDWSIAATEIDADALELACENFEQLGLGDRIDSYQGDLLEALPDSWRPLDVVASNPPYVPEGDVDDVDVEVRDYEPDDALFAGPEGLDIIERLVPQAFEYLDDGGWLLVEIGHYRGEAALELFEQTGFSETRIRQDYGDRDRVTIGRK